jgi:hypothetical protein
LNYQSKALDVVYTLVQLATSYQKGRPAFFGSKKVRDIRHGNFYYHTTDQFEVCIPAMHYKKLKVEGIDWSQPLQLDCPS